MGSTAITEAVPKEEENTFIMEVVHVATKDLAVQRKLDESDNERCVGRGECPHKKFVMSGIEEHRPR
jgi:hypothetical protein